MTKHLEDLQWWFQKEKYVYPQMGEMIQFDEHIFQMGWNHQPATHLFSEVLKWVGYNML